MVLRPLSPPSSPAPPAHRYAAAGLDRGATVERQALVPITPQINGRKRHLLVDTIGLMIAAIVHRADIQDRDGAPLLLATMRSAFPWLRHVFADAGYAGEKLRQALAKLGQWTIDIVRRSDTAVGF